MTAELSIPDPKMDMTPYLGLPFAFPTDHRTKKLIRGYGYAAFAHLILIMFEMAKMPDYRYPFSDLPLLADEVGCTIEMITKIIRESGYFHLVDEQNKSFICPVLSLAMVRKDQYYAAKSVAGQISALKGELKRNKLLEDLKKQLSESDSSQHKTGGVELSAQSSSQQLSNKSIKQLSEKDLPESYISWRRIK